ncbi:hypothetical protein NDU88_001852 [Pleurodeles waltl]|uniref:Uncharacterized protein n=1 Tax=Pleurodeles waltl TaxID=8319 RepID=A0AAV7WMZ4_PLEWA|nr:hypothetical protein NDU88_001852 [Pleurodeles waltl]
MGRGSSVKMVPGAGRGKPPNVRNARSPSARSAVLSKGRMVACGESACAFKCAHTVQKAKKQAPLAVESGGEHGEDELEERPLGGAAKMAAPSGEAYFVSFEPINPNLSARVPEQHGLALEGQRLGRPADFSVPVGVGAPPAHRFEERVQSGAVRPTARETLVHELESSDHVLQDTQVIPASRSASIGLVHNEEELDYENETTVRAVSAPKTRGQAVQGGIKFRA